MCILSLLCNVATLQHRDISTSRRQFYPPLERRDVRFQRRDVDFEPPLESRDVDIQRHDVDFEPLWNVATLISNVATLIVNLLWNIASLASTSRRWKTLFSGTSRRWFQHCDVGKLYSLERRDVVPNVATLNRFKANHLPIFLILPCIIIT